MYLPLNACEGVRRLLDHGAILCRVHRNAARSAMLERRHVQKVASVICMAAAAFWVGGCASRHRPPPQQFSVNAPFSRTFTGPGDSVCWSVKRALLSQGYMLDRGNDGV